MATLVPNPSFSAIPDYSTNPFVTGLKITVTGNTTFEVSAGAARAQNSNFVIEFPGNAPSAPAVLTCDITDLGANGVYPKSIASLSLANKTLMGVYIVANSAGTTGGSLNAGISPAIIVATGDNFLPSNYDVFRRIGFVYVDDATGNLIPMSQSGMSNDRTYAINDSVLALSAGAATTRTAVNLSSGDGVVPPKPDVLVYFVSIITGNAANAFGQVFATGNAGSGNPGGTITPVATGQLGAQFCMPAGQNNAGAASVDYLVNNAGTALTLAVGGFVDNLDASVF